MSAKVLKKEKDRLSILKMLKRYGVVDVTSPNFEINRIRSGTINRNFKVCDGDKTLMLKLFDSNELLPVDRRQVFKMQEELAIIGLAPLPVFLSVNGKVYCEQWVDVGQHEDGKYAHKVKLGKIMGDKLETLAEVLFKVHSSLVSVPLLALDEHWEVYWDKIESPSPQLRQKYLQVKQQWQRYLDVCIDEFVLCHNDLHIEHISYLNGPVFDWEYAGMGCRYFDIASCCTINNLDQGEIESLCIYYANLAHQDIQEVRGRVHKASGMVSFTYELWETSLKISNISK
jgi:Ser/Thr protein kinase RdoA (MazF antagonist)